VSHAQNYYTHIKKSYHMRKWRLLGYLFIFFIIISASAQAQSDQGGYYSKPRDSPTANTGSLFFVSFWQLPDWIKLFYVAAMAAAFLGLLKAMPFVIGKIEDLLKNENRHNILNYIYANPGRTIAQVSQDQRIDRATVKYHLYKLESEGKIVFNKMGKYSRIFRNSHTYNEYEKTVIGHLQNQTGRAILFLVLTEPGITNQEMTERLGVEKSAVHWHVDKFLRDGLISYSPDGKFKRYFIDENARVILEKYHVQVT
jgi:predicted transcriptional regulator